MAEHIPVKCIVKCKEFRCPFMDKRIFDIHSDESDDFTIVYLCNRCKKKCRIYILNSGDIFIEPGGCNEVLKFPF